MPWRVKRMLWLMACGFGALTLAVIVLVRDKGTDTNLLAYLGVLGAAAIILTTLPANGNGKE